MEAVKTMKLRLYTSDKDNKLFDDLTRHYAQTCNFISQYVFDHHFILAYQKLQTALYHTVRNEYQLKAQMTISAFKTVTARYKTVKEQLHQHPYCYRDQHGEKHYIQKTLDWLQKPVHFSRPQADLVRERDYSFLKDGRLSINTLDKRIKVRYVIPKCFESYFDGTWKFGTGKLVKLNHIWYFHIPMTKEIGDSFDPSKPAHVVGIDRGLRYLAVAYDEKNNTRYFDGQSILKRRERFKEVRAELQAKGTKSAKRVLKRLSGRENRWMADINHQLSKTLIQSYGNDTLFVIEDLTNVTFDSKNVNRSSDQNNQLRSWAFYQLEQFLTYKARLNGSDVLKVPAQYTSQRCPKCGRIHKENRDRRKHQYVCDACGYTNNDDANAAMNIYQLGTMYVSGDMHPRFGARKIDDTK